MHSKCKFYLYSNKVHFCLWFTCDSHFVNVKICIGNKVLQIGLAGHRIPPPKLPMCICGPHQRHLSIRLFKTMNSKCRRWTSFSLRKVQVLNFGEVCTAQCVHGKSLFAQLEEHSTATVTFVMRYAQLTPCLNTRHDDAVRSSNWSLYYRVCSRGSLVCESR